MFEFRAKSLAEAGKGRRSDAQEPSRGVETGFVDINGTHSDSEREASLRGIRL